MHTPSSSLHRTILLLALLAGDGGAIASPPAPAPEGASSANPAMPAWEQLTPQQRELLIGPVRERWNESPQRRTSIYRHAQRWQSMTPDQRDEARRGKQRWDHMDPRQRADARVLFGMMRGLPADQRTALRAQWKTMTPEQRRGWIHAHGGDTAVQAPVPEL